MASFAPWNRTSVRPRSTDTPSGGFASLLLKLSAGTLNRNSGSSGPAAAR